MKTQMCKITAFLASLGVLLFSSFSVLASVEVKLLEPNQYRDIEIPDQSRSHGVKSVQKSLTKLFEEVTKEFTEQNKSVFIEVTEIDLAGDVEHFWGSGNRDIRVVKTNDRYRLDFKYQIKNSEQVVIKEGEYKIKDFLDSFSRLNKTTKSNSLNYLEKDLREWVANELVK